MSVSLLFQEFASSLLIAAKDLGLQYTERERENEMDGQQRQADPHGKPIHTINIQKKDFCDRAPPARVQQKA